MEFVDIFGLFGSSILYNMYFWYDQIYFAIKLEIILQGFIRIVYKIPLI